MIPIAEIKVPAEAGFCFEARHYFAAFRHVVLRDNFLRLLLKGASLNLACAQEVLNKFEFFPLKCRVQRALEIFQIEQERKKDTVQQTTFKSKVSEYCVLHISAIVL